MRLAGWVLSLAMLGACNGEPDEPPWTVVVEGQPSALLSVWGSSPTDVWAVGGDPGTGTGPIVAHYDGTTWTKLDSGVRNVDLWWVFGFAGGPVFMSGSNGTILRYQNGAFEKMTTPSTLVVFGMWGAAPDDVWAVGGNFGGGGGGFAWRYNGSTWTAIDAVTDEDQCRGTCWKVGGRAAGDVWISATNGATMHWNGTTLDREDVNVDASLLSVAGNAQRFVTVGGGASDGVLFENEGSGWTSRLPPGGPRLTGVAVSDDAAYAVGQFGSILRRGGSGWAIEKPRMTDRNLHAAWIDPDGGAWAVGGNFDTVPMTAGVLLHKGAPLQGSFP